MAISTSAVSLVNSSLLGGTQNGVQTAALANGGYVTAWTTDLGGQKDVIFQRFDASGNKVGGPVTANATVAGDQVLTDVLARADGTFTLCWTGGNTVTTRSFDGATGLPSSGEANLSVSGASATGAQIILTDASNYKMVMTSVAAGNTIVEQATLAADGSVINAKSTLTSLGAAGAAVTEMVEGNSAGTQFILLAGGRVVSSTNGNNRTFGNAADILKLQTGLHVLADEKDMNAMLVGLTGLGNNLGQYSTTGGSASGGIDATAPTAPDVFARKLVDLGNGRVLVTWVADTGTDPADTADQDGIYAAVFDANTGAFVDDGAYLIKGFGQGAAGAVANLAAITLEASMLSDGRVTVSWSANGDFTGADVFNAIIDPRYNANGGISLGGTENGELLIGTHEDPNSDSEDSGADTISGGGGNDTIVTYGGNDNVYGGGGNDVIYAGDENDPDDQDADYVDAGDGRDFVATGADEDTINGGQGADVLNGGSGDDVVYGGDGNDTVAGGQGLDVLDGGAGTDTLTLVQSGGGEYVDLDYNVSPNGLMAGFDPDEDVLVNFENIIGSGGSDYLAGNAGVNVLRGEGGDDFLQGRGDADRLRGGAGADGFVYEFSNEGGDTIRGFQAGSDKIVIVSDNFGGIDADTILTSLNINSSANAQSAGPKFMFDNAGAGAGQLYYDADGSLSGSARVLIATIRFDSDLGVSTFSAADFEFI